MLLVFDLTDDLWYNKLQVVESVLNDLGVDKNRIIYVGNKIDSAPSEYVVGAREILKENLIMISARKNSNIDELKKAIKIRLQNT